MRFFLGTHMDGWLTTLDVPLFVSHRRLDKRKRLLRAAVPWALDSGGFTELATYGEWRTSPEQYVRAVRRYRDEVGSLAWAAPQDWMCEPQQLQNTGRTVAEHQALTIANYLDLRERAPDLPFIPVLQGWVLADYLRHVDAYADAGVDLIVEPTVGLGSVCRREATSEIHRLIAALAVDRGLRLHGFGVKTSGLRMYGALLASADSMAWSFAARARKLRMPECTHRAVYCQNCPRWAMEWRRRALVALVPAPIQPVPPVPPPPARPRAVQLTLDVGNA